MQVERAAGLQVLWGASPLSVLEGSFRGGWCLVSGPCRIFTSVCAEAHSHSGGLHYLCVVWGRAAQSWRLWTLMITPPWRDFGVLVRCVSMAIVGFSVGVEAPRWRRVPASNSNCGYVVSAAQHEVDSLCADNYITLVGWGSVIVRRLSMTIEGFSAGVEAPLLPANGASPRAAVWQVEGIRISVSVGYAPSVCPGRQCPRRLVHASFAAIVASSLR